MDSQAPAERILMFVWCVFCSSSSYRIIFLANEIERRRDFKNNCEVVPQQFPLVIAVTPLVNSFWISGFSFEVLTSPTHSWPTACRK